MAATMLGMAGALLCAAGPAWGARGWHRTALTLMTTGALLALFAASRVLGHPH
jgi:hypothetical protein